MPLWFVNEINPSDNVTGLDGRSLVAIANILYLTERIPNLFDGLRLAPNPKSVLLGFVSAWRLNYDIFSRMAEDEIETLILIAESVGTEGL